MVLAPEHELVEKITIPDKKAEVKKYQEETKKKLDIERQVEDREKTGIFTGAYAVNPATKEKIPIYIADYVLPHYGYGAIMGVPAHDERDYKFANKYELSIKEVIVPYFHSDNVREDKKIEERDVVTVIVKNSKTNQYLCLNWKDTGWNTFPAGGIDGRNMIVAARKEVEEETGYKNLKFIKQIGGSIYADFYRPHKDSNVKAHFRYLLFELEDEECIKVSDQEEQQHSAVWIDENKIESYINVWNQKIAWKRLIEDGCAYCGDGRNVNSGPLDGMETQKAVAKATKLYSKKAVNYKLRDWVFSRQRYWGEPIPLVFCEDCKKRVENGNYKKGEFNEGELLNPGWIALPNKELPLKLPKLEKYQPTSTGESPLAQAKDWIEATCPKCGGKAIRETNTMPQWAGSCWYFLAYVMLKGQKLNSKFKIQNSKLIKYWLPVDFYVGGAEHAVLHLLYSRFWIKVLYDVKIIHFDEPFLKLQTIGLILAPDGQKMSKSRGNVINPDDIIEKHGADTFRLYEMFMGPFDQPTSWDSEGILGTKRFLEKVWNIFSELNEKVNKKIERKLHQTIKKITEDIEAQKFNTAIAAMMELVNEAQNHGISQKQAEDFLKILTPFAPHITEELWQRLGYENSIFKEKWPEYDKKLIKEEAFYLIVQINGKKRDTIKTPLGISKKQAKELALKSEKIRKWLENKKIKKIIFIKDKLINFVI
jgi:leucyl-tRNA synthetase